MKQFLRFLRELWRGFRSAMRSRFKWVVLLFGLWLYRVEFMPDTGGGMAKVLQVGTLMGMLLMILSWRGNIVTFSFNRTGAGVKSVLLLYLYAIISTVWAFLPQFAFFLSLQNVVLIMGLVCVMTYMRSFRDMERFFILFVSGMVIFESLAVRMFDERNLFVHFLPAASSSAMLFSYSIAEWLNTGSADTERKMLLRNAMILALLVLLFSTSGGANASAVFGLGVALFFSKKRFYAILLMGVGAFIFLNRELVDDILLFLMPGKNMETIESGNGRETIWEVILEIAAEKPWFGWGYACVERVNQLDVIQGQSLSDAHNSYIGIYGSLGIVGCMFLGIHIISHVLFVFKRIGRVGYAGLFAATCCALLNAYTYGYLSGKACSITVTYFYLVVLAFTYDRCKVVSRKKAL